MKNNIVNRAIEVFREEGMEAFFRKTLVYFFSEEPSVCLMNIVGNFALPYCRYKIKHLGRKLTLDELVDFAFDSYMELIKPLQVRSEIIRLLKLVKMMKPKRILEIGTARGGTLFLFARVSSEDATIVSIDLWRGKFGGSYPKWKKSLYRSFALPNQKIHLLQANSHKRATLRQAKAILGDEKCDFLFIDADHTYKGVKKDFEMYSPLTRKGSIIAFHDIVPHRIETSGVPQFWREIKRSYESEEIVEDCGQIWGGIGLIKV